MWLVTKFATSPSLAENKAFRLLRYFSMASAVALIASTVATAVVFRQVAEADLVWEAERTNVALADSFANSLWPRFASYVKSTSNLEGKTLRARPETREIHESLNALVAGLPVLKVKIYNLDGLTVFSSELAQIGEYINNNPGFLSAARQGNPASKLVHKGKFSAFSGEVVARDLVETYTPIRRGDSTVEAVFEIYTDVTPVVERVSQTTVKIVAGIVLLFGILYGVLFVIALHADRIIRRQYFEIGDRNIALAEMTEDLAEARDRAMAASRVKSDFLAQMSHELRTPLNAIIGFSEMMKERIFGPLGDSHYEDYAEHIHTSGAHLLALINDVLDLSKVEAGKLEMHEEAVDIEAVVATSLQTVAEPAAAGKVALSAELAKDLPLVRADERMVTQILLNLLSNAVKFTAEGGRVTVRAGLDGNGGMALVVADTGIGIRKEDIATVLTPFDQIDSSLGRKRKGVGLGLPLAKALAEMHGGKLALDSEAGIGTTITVRFPAERVVVA